MLLTKLEFWHLFSNKFSLLMIDYRHENVIAYKDSFFEDKTQCLCIIMEFADNGDLAHKISEL